MASRRGRRPGYRSSKSSSRLAAGLVAELLGIREGASWLDLMIPGLWDPGPGLITGMILPTDDGPIYLTGLGDALARLPPN